MEWTNIFQFTYAKPRDYTAAQTTSCTYDAQSNLTRTTFTDGSFVSYGYDDFGCRTDASGKMGQA